MSARDIGTLGENIALAKYLELGYRLRGRNFRVRQGEVDLILEKDGVLVFCEVKTRGPRAPDTPAAWVDSRKQRNIVQATQAWLLKNGYNEPLMRFDVAEVFLRPGAGGARVNIMESAFDA